MLLMPLSPASSLRGWWGGVEVVVKREKMSFEFCLPRAAQQRSLALCARSAHAASARRRRRGRRCTKVNRLPGPQIEPLWAAPCSASVGSLVVERVGVVAEDGAAADARDHDALGGVALRRGAHHDGACFAGREQIEHGNNIVSR